MPTRSGVGSLGEKIEDDTSSHEGLHEIRTTEQSTCCRCDADVALVTRNPHHLLERDLLPETPRLIFVETDKVEELPAKSAQCWPRYKTDERTMTAEHIAMLDQALKEVLWITDVILETRMNELAWRHFFKDHRYHASIIGIFTALRVLVKSLVDRENADATRPVFSHKKLKIAIGHLPCPSTPQCIANVYM
jgi:hypothetical protein